jgi:hypothetical protein
LSALKQLVFGVYLFDCSTGIIPNEILSHHYVTWLRRRKYGSAVTIRPKLCRSVGRANWRGQHHLSKIHRASFRGDGPQYIGHILGADLVRRRHVIEMGFDFRRSRRLFTPASPRATGISAVPRNVSRAGAVAVIDGFVVPETTVTPKIGSD